MMATLFSSKNIGFERVNDVVNELFVKGVTAPRQQFILLYALYMYILYTLCPFQATV